MSSEPNSFLDNFDLLSSPIQVRSTSPSPIRSPSPASNRGSRKRGRSDSSNTRIDDDDELSPPPRQNRRLGPDTENNLFITETRAARLTQLVQELSTTRQLTDSQLNEATVFAKAPMDEMLVQLFVAMMQARDREAEKARTLAKFEVSREQDDNIRMYARAIIASAAVKQYKSAATDNLLKNLVRLLRWDIPPAVYNNPSASATLTSRIKFHLTQERAKLKDKVQTSIAGDDPKNYQHIYTLATAVAEYCSTNRKVTTQLCIRLAFLRAMILTNNDHKYWERVDEKLSEIRAKVTDPDKYVKYFKRIYDDDRNKYGKPVELAIYPDNHPIIDTTEVHVKNAIENSTELGNPVEGSSTGWI